MFLPKHLGHLRVIVITHVRQNRRPARTAHARAMTTAALRGIGTVRRLRLLLRRRHHDEDDKDEQPEQASKRASHTSSTEKVRTCNRAGAPRKESEKCAGVPAVGGTHFPAPRA